MDDHDGQSSEPAANQPKPLTPPPKLAALTVFVRWRPLCWLDKPLAGLLGIEPRLLTSRVKLEPVRFEGTLRERWQLWLWQVQSWRGSLTLSLAVFDFILLIAILLAWLGLTPSWRPTDPVAIAAGPGAAAAYSGLLFGFLLTVALFAVQVRASRQDTSVLPLSPMISKKHRTFIVLSLTAGVAIANLFFAFAGPVFGIQPAMLSAVGIMNGPLLATLTLMAIWYMSRVLADAGAADLEMAMPAIEMAMREQLALDSHYAKQRATYKAWMSECGIEINPLMFYIGAITGHRVETITLDSAGIVVDVDCYRLYQLGSAIKTMESAPDVWLKPYFNDSIDDHPTFKLRWLKQPEGETAPPIERFEEAAKAVLIVARRGRRMPANQVRQFLVRFRAVLKTLAREGREIEFKDRLEELGSLRDAWLSVIPPNATPPARSRWLQSNDTFDGPFEVDLDDMVEAAVQSKDPPSTVALLRYLFRSVHVCKEACQYQLMAYHLDIAASMWYRCVQLDEFREPIGHKLDSFLGTMFMMERPDARDDDEEALQKEAVVHITLLRFSLRLIRTAIRHDDAKHAQKFADRIFDHHETYGTPTQDHDYEGVSAEDFYSRSDYAGIVLLGWSLEVLGHEPAKGNAAALKVREYVVGQLPSVPRLIALWELFRGDSARRSPVDGRLGITEWDVRDWNEEWRSGRPVSRNGPTDVPRLGLRAALLLTKREHTGKAEDFFAGPPTRHMWATSQNHEAKLKKLVADPRLNLDESARADRLQRAIAMVHDRRRAGDVAYLQYVLQENISETRWSKYRDDATNGYKQHQSWIVALRSVGVGTDEIQATTLASGVERDPPREYLIDGNNSVSGLGANLGDITASQEAFKLFGDLEDKARPSKSCQTLASLSEAIRHARKSLQGDGYHPNVLVLPREQRIRSSVFDMPSWQVPGKDEFRRASLGRWEGLLVLRCPYPDTSHALLLDTRKLLTTAHRDSEANPTIEIIEGRDDPELSKACQAAEEALQSGGALPDSHTIRVLTRMVSPPPLAIADINASLAIDLRQAAGYVLDEKANVYHRPGCELIGEGEHERYLHLPHDKRPSACEKCKPDEWDYEAERRRRTQVETEPQDTTEDEI